MVQPSTYRVFRPIWQLQSMQQSCCVHIWYLQIRMQHLPSMYLVVLVYVLYTTEYVPCTKRVQTWYTNACLVLNMSLTPTGYTALPYSVCTRYSFIINSNLVHTQVQAPHLYLRISIIGVTIPLGTRPRLTKTSLDILST